MEANNLKGTQEKRTRLKTLLAKNGILQKDLAEAAKVEMYQISQLCSGKKTNIMLDTAKRIANALGVTLDAVFGDDDMDTDVPQSNGQ